MKAEIVLMTPELAKKLLNNNPGNRKIKAENVPLFREEMLSGRWLENGEPIIVATDGRLMNGQHRLLACISANYSWHCPLITEIDFSTMKTLDTGSIRSIHDVLSINGIQNSHNVASVIKRIFSYVKKKRAHSGSTKQLKLSTSVALAYGLEHNDGIQNVMREVQRVYLRQNVRVYSTTDLALILYLISGSTFDFGPTQLAFLKLICGVGGNENTPTTHIHNRLVKLKLNKSGIKTDGYWKHCITIVAWNMYIEGNSPVSGISFASRVFNANYPTYPLANQLETA